MNKGLSDASAGNTSAVNADIATLKADGNRMGRDITTDTEKKAGKLAGQFEQVFNTYIGSTNPTTAQQALSDDQQVINQVLAICKAKGYSPNG